MQVLIKKVFEEMYRVRKGKSLYKGLSERDYECVMYFTKNAAKREISSRNLASYKRVANILDVPMDFVVSIVRMEGMDDGKDS